MSNWVFLGKATADGSATSLSIDFSAKPRKRFLKFIIEIKDSNTGHSNEMKYNDSTSGYTWVDWSNLASHSSDTGQGFHRLSGDINDDSFITGWIINLDGKEKQCVSRCTKASSGDSATVSTSMGFGTWTGTDQITKMTWSAEGQTIDSGSQIVVWGADDQGSTSVDKSKTSITNVPAGTRYEEVDTRKIFRFKEGGEAQANNVFNATNYTWVTAGNSGVTITTGDDGTGQGVSAGTLSSYRRGKTTITSGNTKTFVWKFTWTRNSGDAANNSIFTLANFDWSDSTPSGDQKNIKFQCSNGNVGFWRAQTASASVTSTQDGTFLQSAGTTRYYTVTGDGTNWKAQSWDNAARTTDEKTTGNLAFPSDWLTTDPIDNITLGSFGTASSDFTVKEVSVKWDSGTADSWVEKGVAA